MHIYASNFALNYFYWCQKCISASYKNPRKQTPKLTQTELSSHHIQLSLLILTLFDLRATANFLLLAEKSGLRGGALWLELPNFNQKFSWPFKVADQMLASSRNQFYISYVSGCVPLVCHLVHVWIFWHDLLRCCARRACCLLGRCFCVRGLLKLDFQLYTPQ